MGATYLDLIVKKRNHLGLSAAEIDDLVGAIAAGTMPDHQVGALLMAIYLNGLDSRETAHFTLAMVRSGQTVDLRAIDGFKADKHSTGGVGDKVTLVLGPLVAAAGVKFPKLSGRGLAHTGGTLDKLESIPGMRVDLSMEEFIDQVRAIGLAVTGQTRELAPADGVLYALRDQTGTVDSIPLIASSVMCKKLAAGADGILLDVKCGRGAFMKTQDDARELARQMVAIGRAAGKQTRAVVTSMDTPLGLAVGNALEVREAIDTLRGSGPDDVLREVLALSAEIIAMAGLAAGGGDAEGTLRELLEDGSALEKLREMIGAQGGNARVVDDPDLLPQAPVTVTVESTMAGHVQAVDALAIGGVAMDLGAGRRAKSDSISFSAGVVLRAKPSAHLSQVEIGSPLAELHIPADRVPAVPLDLLRSRTAAAFTIGPDPPNAPPAVLATISQEL